MYKYLKNNGVLFNNIARVFISITIVLELMLLSEIIIAPSRGVIYYIASVFTPIAIVLEVLFTF